MDQALARVPADPAGRERRRRGAVAGAYALRSAPNPAVTLSAMGTMIPEALDAARRLEQLGFGTEVICVTSPDLLFRAVQARRGLGTGDDWILGTVFPPRQAAPMVTLLDGHPHTLAFLAGINSVPATHLGVTNFGVSGDLENVYRHHGIDAGSIVGAALDLID